MLLPTSIDFITLAAAKSNDSLYCLDHVRIDPVKQTITASNGHSLYQASFSSIQSEEYPSVEPTGNIPPAEVLCLPTAAIDKAIRNRPSKSSRAILKENILLTIDPGKPNTASLTTTDLYTTDSVSCKSKDQTEYPDIDTIIASVNTDNDPATTVTLSTAELELLVKVLKKAGEESVTLQIRGPNKPVSATARSFFGVIMPCFP